MASHDVRFHIGFAVFAVVCAGAKSVTAVAGAVVGTALARVLSLLTSTASAAFMRRGGEVVRMATNIRLGHALRSYRLAASAERQEPARYAGVKLHDLFPGSSRHAPVTDNPASFKVLNDVREKLLPSNRLTTGNVG